MPLLTTLILSLAVIALGNIIIRTRRNYRTASRLGYPIVFSPLSPVSAISMIFGGHIARLLRLLNVTSTWVSVIYIGWQYDDARKPADAQVHSIHGSVFTIVSPGSVQLVVADSAVAREVLKNVKIFQKPDLYKTLDIYGPNVNTLNGDSWARQRRLTAPCFNEHINDSVWITAEAEAQQTLSLWADSKKHTDYTPTDASRTIALDVLLSTAFACDPHSDAEKNNATRFRNALREVLHHIVLVSLLYTTLNIPEWLFLPKSWADALQAAKLVQRYMQTMLVSRDSKVTSHKGRKNLIDVLRAQMKDDSGDDSLTLEEIMGNLFIFSLAGHDTTASTLAYSICILAAQPKWQAWLREELKETRHCNTYETRFPMLIRCKAIMYETLRLYGPIAYIPRVVKSEGSPRTLALGNEERVFDAEVNVIINVQAMHTSRNTWGPHALDFNPTRWLRIDDGKESIEDAGDTFLPWASGPRACPGSKFSQVEFVSAVSTLFSSATAESSSDNESLDSLQAIIDNSGFTGATLHMWQADQVRVTWRRRSV